MKLETLQNLDGVNSEIRADLTNRGEYKSFLKTALAIQGSATPAVTQRVALVSVY